MAIRKAVPTPTKMPNPFSDAKTSTGKGSFNKLARKFLKKT